MEGKGMSKLPAYFKSKVWESKFLGRSIELPNKKNVEEWATRILYELNPEVISKDGELSRDTVRLKYTRLKAALNYLERIAGHKLDE